MPCACAVNGVIGLRGAPPRSILGCTPPQGFVNYDSAPFLRESQQPEKAIDALNEAPRRTELYGRANADARAAVTLDTTDSWVKWAMRYHGGRLQH